MAECIVIFLQDHLAEAEYNMYIFADFQLNTEN